MRWSINICWLAASLLLVLGAFLVACGGGGGGDGRLKVVATTTQIGDFARNVGGDRISLTVLVKPNQDAHDFAPQPSQVRALEEADLVLRHGLGLDGYVDKIVKHAGRVVAVTEGIDVRAGSSDQEPEDPHVWFSVANAKTMVEDVRDAFSQADAPNASFYAENAAAYLKRLDQLDGELRAEVAQVPSSCRKIVTNHDFLAYYAADYGFEIVGSVIPATSTEAQASASDVADIVRKVKAAGVPAIFAESSVNPDLIRQVGREANVKVVDDLYSDSLGAKSSDGGTYIDMMKADTKKIVDALKTC
jgi:zinc/manganese transport system substrate-binding protein/manganese/iron transport system substrate-binding protein